MFKSGQFIARGAVEVLNRTEGRFEPVNTRRDVIYWNDGNVRMHQESTGRLIDLGRGYVKENWQAWARQHGVDFRDGRHDVRQHREPRGSGAQ